jgi:hypothetical protein
VNREQRRHPEKAAAPRPPQEKKHLDKSAPDDEQSVRAKSSRHKKSTADKWNQ